MEKEIIQKQIELANKDVIEKEILIGYLETLKKDMTKEEKAQTDIKITALKRDINFNKGYVEYASNL